ncbi:MAG: DUF6448 family protein [Methanoregula sp.]|nr:DUF6448 family protein [Methanoregula sp.]
MSAAMRALETGEAHYILIWIPEASENKLKNLLEKAYYERYTQKNAHTHIVDWYFTTVNHLHSGYFGPRNLDISKKNPEEKMTISLVERAFENGNFEEIGTIIPDTPTGEMRQRFDDVMKKRDYREKNIAAGRVYVSAFTDFIVFVNNIRSGSI